MKDRIILGIDPGSRMAGYSLLSLESGSPKALDLGYLEMSSKLSIAHRLAQYDKFLNDKIEEFNVNLICLETPFLGRNAQTFLKLGYFRGVTLLAGQKHKIDILEFAPRQVKKAVTGSGSADKDQVARALFMMFPKIAQFKKTAINDVTDALAVGLCGLWDSQANVAKRL